MWLGVVIDGTVPMVVAVTVAEVAGGFCDEDTDDGNNRNDRNRLCAIGCIRIFFVQIGRAHV